MNAPVIETPVEATETPTSTQVVTPTEVVTIEAPLVEVGPGGVIPVAEAMEETHQVAEIESVTTRTIGVNQLRALLPLLQERVGLIALRDAAAALDAKTWGNFSKESTDNAAKSVAAVQAVHSLEQRIAERLAAGDVLNELEAVLTAIL